jgi:hypothetical protein
MVHSCLAQSRPFYDVPRILDSRIGGSASILAAGYAPIGFQTLCQKTVTTSNNETIPNGKFYAGGSTVSISIVRWFLTKARTQCWCSP